MDKTEMLKACPFCANETDDRGYGVLVCETRAGGHHWWEVQCQQCEASGPAKDTEAEAIAAWNERTPRPDNALAGKLERLLKWHRWDDARLAHWLRGAGDRILTALRARKSEGLADEAVEHVLAHVAGGGPHEWGYRDPVTGEFIADDWPFRAADALAAIRSLIEPQS